MILVSKRIDRSTNAPRLPLSRNPKLSERVDTSVGQYSGAGLVPPFLLIADKSLTERNYSGTSRCFIGLGLLRFMSTKQPCAHQLAHQIRFCTVWVFEILIPADVRNRSQSELLPEGAAYTRPYERRRRMRARLQTRRQRPHSGTGRPSTIHQRIACTLRPQALRAPQIRDRGLRSLPCFEALGLAFEPLPLGYAFE